MAHESISEHPWHKTLTCETPSGGKHLYFQFCEGVPNKANALGPGLDIWHGGHYVILPPSNHHAGHEYKWSAGPQTLEPFPTWLKPKPVDVPKKKGRPPKEKLNPTRPEEIEKLQHALKYVDSTNRDLWV